MNNNPYFVVLFEHVLKDHGWTKNKTTREWEKNINWINLHTNERRDDILVAANDLDQLLDFGAGAYLEGSHLKEIFGKKIKRGHDVDISDIMNVAMVNDGTSGKHKDEWSNAFEAFEEAANTRSTRTTSNIISLCRYSHALADHHDRIAKSIEKYNDLIFDKEKFDDMKIKKISKLSIHWIDFLEKNGVEATRNILHDFYHEQAEKKRPIHAKNLRTFAIAVLEILNSRYTHLKVLFDIEN